MILIGSDVNHVVVVDELTFRFPCSIEWIFEQNCTVALLQQVMGESILASEVGVVPRSSQMNYESLHFIAVDWEESSPMTYFNVFWE